MQKGINFFLVDELRKKCQPNSMTNDGILMCLLFNIFMILQRSVQNDDLFISEKLQLFFHVPNLGFKKRLSSLEDL